MVNYIEIQNKVIEEYKIIIIKNSTCWQRTHAHCRDKSRRICKWIQTNGYVSTFSLLHEIGHIETTEQTMPRALRESEATRWAINKLKELGIKIKHKQVNKYKEYIRVTYERGLCRGLQKKIKSKLLL